MAQNTNLNVTPYYDDFDKDKNFYKVLYRPGFPIQARELTTMQSVLQHQVESVGSHLFKDGAMVIPGQVGYDLTVDSIMLQESFLGADVELYRSQLDGKIIEGLTSGVKAKVLYSISDQQSEKGYLTLYLKYIESGTDEETGEENSQKTFIDNEQLITDVEITFGTTLIEVGSPFAQLLPTNSVQQGSVAYIQPGVYFIRGYFVDIPYQYILLDQYGTDPSYRIGLNILESIVTPEDDDTLNDNAAGTSNYAAPGAHRFKITAELAKKELDDDADKDFIELLRIKKSSVEKIVDRTAYSELEKSLALRTYEESGDYVVDDFEITLRNSLDIDDNDGVFESGETTDDGNAPSDNLYTVEFSPGSAYVRGYRIENLNPTYVDLEKPRDTESIQNSNIAFVTGNNVRLNNIWGFPNVSGSTVTNAYQVIELRDASIATPGTASGNLIGYARAFNIEYDSDEDGTYGNASDIYKMNLFDVQMLTAIRLDVAKSITAGSVVIGSQSGARGLIVETYSSTRDMYLYQVEGVFVKGETLTVDNLDFAELDEAFTYKFSNTRSVSAKDEVGLSVEFTADVILDDILQIQGSSFTYNATGGSEEITGLQSNFKLDLQPGDRIYFSTTNYVDVLKVPPASLSTQNEDDIFDYAAQTVLVTPPTANFPSAGSYTNLVRYRSQLTGSSTASLLSEMPKKYVKSISDESMVVRRTFDSQSVPSGSLSITLPEGEQFEGVSDKNYTVTVLASTNVTYPNGSRIPLSTGSGNSAELGYTTFATTERTTLQIDNLTNITSVKVTATISKTTAGRKTKSANEMFVLKVNKTVEDLSVPKYNLQYSNIYGTRIQDKDISLGVKDAFRLHAVYESVDDNDPVIPSITLVEPSFFATGTTVKGRVSGAEAKVVNFSSGDLKLTIVYLGDTIFQTGETVTGTDSNGLDITGIVSDAEGSIVIGSKVVTDDYFLEVNQTDFIYSISKIVRKKDSLEPIKKLKIVFDYYTHSATGDYFSGQSYLNTNYSDIPFYEVAFLADFIDYRPSVKDFVTLGTVSSPALVTTPTLDFNSRSFTISGSPTATVFDIPQIESNFKCDFDWYLPRTDKIFLSPDSRFQIIKGKSSESPEEPDDIKDSMLLAVINHRPYGFDPEVDAAIVKSDNKRYTMRDIGSLERRLDQVEYYTSLNMLESDTLDTKITDANGKDRLKNGFIVDDFTDHGKSDTSNEDFNAALDFQEGICRPSHYTTNVPLEVNDSLSSNIQKTNGGGDTSDIITLPYTELLIAQQPYASRVENINPFNVFAYIGRIDLVPSSDDWVDTRRLPTQVTQIEGNFQAVSSELNVDQNGFAPIQWRAWRTAWTSERTISSRITRNRGWLRQDIGRSPRPNVWRGRGMRRVNRTTTIATTTRRVRTGIRTRVVPRIDRRNLGDSLVSSTTIPWIRSRNIRITAQRLKPRTRFYTFFDKRRVDAYITPKMLEVIKDPTVDNRSNSIPFEVGETVRGLNSRSRMRVASPNSWYEFNPYDDTELPSSYSSTTNFVNLDVYSSALQTRGRYFGNFQVGEVIVGTSGARAVVRTRRHITDRFGKYRGTFFIPSPVGRNPRWRTGSRTIRMTSESKDTRVPGAVASAAEVTYEAKGTLNRVRRNVLAVRNAQVVRDTVTQRRTIRSVRTETRQIGWYDPLAQSFISDEQGGVFVTSVEIFFRSKDPNIPVSMQIRTMENGYPTTNILPFSDVTLEPSAIQISETGAIATKFTFQAPVYIPQSQEHCFVLLSDSNSYQVWISRMGEVDITGDRTISEQPYAGVLFKSQNASTWTADQYEDLKFNLYRAEFDNSVNSTLVLNNTELELGNGGKLNLRTNPIQTFVPEINLTLNNNESFSVGARIYQKTTLAEGTITAVNTANVAGTILTVNDITGTFAQGDDVNSIITNRIVSSKTEATLVITAASNTGQFTVGQTITGGTSGATAEIVSWTSGTNTLTLRYVSDEFTAGSPGETITQEVSGGTDITATVSTITYSGDTVSGGAPQDTFPASTPVYTSSQRKIKVFHSNHGMHDANNNVIIEGVKSEITDTYLTASISATDTTFSVNDANEFHKTINGAVISSSNPGYLRIFNETEDLETVAEVVSYSAISDDGKTITVYERGVDGTTAISHADETVIQCYNLDGIPLTEINKTHTSILNPTLDSYELTTTSIAKEGISAGGSDVIATQNIHMDICVPQIERMLLPETDVVATINGISGTSINDGSVLSQSSFSNDGVFRSITLSEDNSLPFPFLIASAINESSELSGNKSFRMNLTLSSQSSNLSPVIDTDRLSITSVMNRINNPSDTTSATLPNGDKHSAVYITRIATLENPSGSIKVFFTGYRPPNSEIKVLYRIKPVGSSESIETLGYEYFPTADATIPAPTESENYQDYEYEVTGLKFDQYQIKIVFASPDQSAVPIISDLRAIALAV
tara:strand:- start:5808 stop:13097 length:7290 start_codon:yes stop_codon:yes gene_type:complete